MFVLRETSREKLREDLEWSDELMQKWGRHPEFRERKEPCSPIKNKDVAQW